MTPNADFVCRYCQFTLEASTSYGEFIEAEHIHEESFNGSGEIEMCNGKMFRSYSNIHTGPGSNGEPPR